MAALVLLVIGVIATPILLLITHSSGKDHSRKTDDQAVRYPIAPRRTCPRCGSPVIQYKDGWECGWCGDSCRY